ncbi:unnamed protein product [Chironomus riparius]|uniref:NACHT domain-containing protein n=1 Tax=Chironomus riparius TaxID=315576 RepID=A0A9N9S1U8_9DIPT|nr:unnamed protein product [Chironomus riparius]
MGALVSKDTKFKNLFPFLKKRILQRTVNFQGYQTTLLELVKDEKDIMNDLTSGEIKLLLENKEVLRINTGHNLRHEFSLIERKFVYEDLENGSNHFICEEEKMSFKNINGSKLIVLSDLASTGKSIAFRHFAARLKDRRRNYWVSYIELRRYRNLFELYANKDVTDQDASDILLICMGVKTDFEYKLLKKSLLNGQAIIFFDGIDEAIPSFTKILKKIFEILSKSYYSRTQLWISTRPHMSSSFQQILESQESFKFAPFTRKHVDVYKFAPMTDQEKCSIINNMINFQGINEPGQQKKIRVEVLEYLKELKSDDSCRSDINNLYMIQSIVDYCTYHRRKLNIESHYDVFATIVEDQLDLAKIHPKERVNDTILNIWEVHRALALLTSFPSMSMNSLTIVKDWNEDKMKWTSDYIQRYGFIYGNLNSTVKFVHKSYADFFVAQFIISFLYGDNNNMSIIEVKSIVSLFIRIMCGHRSDKVCCNFLISYFKTLGKSKIVSNVVKSAIYDNLRHIHDPNNINRFSKNILKNFAIFMSTNVDMKIKFFKLRDKITLLDEYVLKGWMESHSSIFIEAVTASLGPNWHQLFNRSPIKLITNETIEKYEIRYNDYDMIKICDLYYRSLNIEAKNRFLNNFYRVPCYSGYIQVDIIDRMMNSNPGRFVEECFIKICYDHITPQAIALVFEGVSQLCSIDRVREILFHDFPEWTPPLLQSSRVSNPEVFEQTRKFYIRYAYTWVEIQNLFLFRHVHNLFAPCTTPVFKLYKEFLEMVFANNKWQLKNKILSLVINKNNNKLDKSLKCANTRNLFNWMMSSEGEAVDNIYEKIFEKD